MTEEISNTDNQDLSAEQPVESPAPEVLVTAGNDDDGKVLGVPDWMLRKDSKLTNDKPEWMTKDTMEDEARAYGQSEKRLGELKKEVGDLRKEKGLFAEGVPEQYDFAELNDDSFAVDMEAPLMKDFLSYCNENKVPQNMATKMVELYKNDFLSTEVDTKSEMAKLGSDANMKLMNVRNWVAGNASPEAAQNILGMVKTAADFNALLELKEGMKEQSIPTSIKSSPGMTNVEEYQKQIRENYSEIRKNPDMQMKMIKSLEAELNK